MEFNMRWLDRYERRSGEVTPNGLILCGEKNGEQVEPLQLDRAISGWRPSGKSPYG